MSSSYATIVCTIAVLFSTISLSYAENIEENEEALREAAKNGELNCIPSNYSLLRCFTLIILNSDLNFCCEKFIENNLRR